MYSVPELPSVQYQIAHRPGGALVELHCAACGAHVVQPCSCPDPRGAWRWVDLFASQHSHGRDDLARFFGYRYHQALNEIRGGQ